MRIRDSFTAGLQAPWRITQLGPASVTTAAAGLRLENQPNSGDHYCDAQISDYGSADFQWRPPLRLSVRASAQPEAAQLRGTAGFGFWNQPFMPGQVRLRLPQALWFFFSSPPSEMRLAQNVPGPGWKAATFDAHRWQFFALLPAAPLALPLMRIPALYRRLWPIGQRAIGVSESLLDENLLAEMHDYRLEWRSDGASFYVDEHLVHQSPYAPGGPLGFVAWIDNQYAVVTPQGHFGFGLVPLEQTQSLTIEYVNIEPC